MDKMKRIIEWGIRLTDDNLFKVISSLGTSEKGILLNYALIQSNQRFTQIILKCANLKVIDMVEYSSIAAATTELRKIEHQMDTNTIPQPIGKILASTSYNCAYSVIDWVFRNKSFGTIDKWRYEEWNDGCIDSNFPEGAILPFIIHASGMMCVKDITMRVITSLVDDQKIATILKFVADYSVDVFCDLIKDIMDHDIKYSVLSIFHTIVFNPKFVSDMIDRHPRYINMIMINPENNAFVMCELMKKCRHVSSLFKIKAYEEITAGLSVTIEGGKCVVCWENKPKLLKLCDKLENDHFFCEECIDEGQIDLCCVCQSQDNKKIRLYISEPDHDPEDKMTKQNGIDLPI